MKKCSTWQAQIFCGLREGYSNTILPISFLYEICRRYVNAIGWCVTVTPTKYIYKDGEEDGAMIGVIADPRFLFPNDELEERTINLAKELQSYLKQTRISVSFPDKTIMLESFQAQEKVEDE